jgi:hypothetical protein
MAESQYAIQAVLSVGYANSAFVVWNSSTALNTTAGLVNADYSYNSLIVTLAQTSTITGGVVTFQASTDGVNWFNIQGFTPGNFASIGPTYTLQANTYATFEFNLTAIPYFQVVLSTAITGTGQVTIGYAADSFVNTMAIGGTVAVSGTVAVTQSTSPWVVSGTVAATQSGTWNIGTLTSITNPVTVTGTVAVTQSTSPWVVSLTSTTITGTVAVTQSTSPWVVDGNLTNNNAAPAATLVGVLPAIAETAYTTVTYTTGDMVLPVTDLHGALNIDHQAQAGVALGATAVVNFGTAPAAVVVPAVNSSIFAGTSALTATGSSLNVNITGGSTSGTQYTNGTAVATGSLVGTEALGYDGANVRAIATDTSGRQIVIGNLTNNNAAPAATNVGVLPAIAETAYTTITYTTGDQVLPVTDLHGALNTDLQAVGGSVVVTAAAGIQKVGIVGNASAVFDAVIGAGSAAPNMIQVGGVYNSTAPTLTTGQSAALQLDASGNLRVTSLSAGTSNTAVAAWTSATAVNTAVTLINATFAYNTLMITLNQTTTLTAGAVTFEASNDNTNWFVHEGVDAVFLGSPDTVYPLQASTYKVYKFNISAFQYFRVRLSTAITGTGTVTIGYAAQSDGSPIEFVQEMKDTGRTYIALVVNNVNSVTTEALMSLSINKGGTTTTATNYTVTTGKIFRIQSFSGSCLESNTRIIARAVTTGTVTATSSILCALTSTGESADQDFPDGLELPAGSNIGITSISSATGNFVTAALVGYEY